MGQHSSRREFLRTAAMTGVGIWVADSAWAKGNRQANDRLNFACIGISGKGGSDTADAAKHGNVVAICDIDDNKLAEAKKKYPNAQVYHDFRKMLEEMGKDVDAVTVSTPDHTHAPAAAMAMLMGKHCFCQKPLTRTIYEARRLGEIARKMKVATQMGNQGTASSGLRRSAAVARSGALGAVREVHVWTDRPIWPQGGPRPEPKTPPPHVHWNEWLGPAPERPYGDNYHPFAWRGWWDFGTGALGDMACHTFNMPFMALDLRNPVSVQAESAGHNKDSFPQWAVITFEFPATRQRPAVKVVWYDGGKRPAPELLNGQKVPVSGSLLIGEKDTLYTPGDYGNDGRLLSGAEMPEVSYDTSPGHFTEFVRAIKEGKPAVSNFPDYAGPLSETILLGNLAVWAEGKKIEWDAKRLRAKNAPEVADLIKPTYRTGYTLG